MGPSEPILRRLRESDIPDAMVLKEAAGWNQTEEDWRLLLDQLPEGSFALESSGRVVATSTAVSYDRDLGAGGFGWVGMVLVHPEERRQGYGTQMLEAAVDFLERSGMVAALDATAEGKLVYDRRGFGDLFGVERHVGTVSAPAGGVAADIGCEVLEPSRIDAVDELDRAAFGADRSGILRGFLVRPESVGWVHRTGREVSGYLLGRQGSRFFHLGPWVATGEAAARALWATARTRLEGRVVGIDVPVPNAVARGLAAEAGLPVVRSLTRMVRPLGGGPGTSVPASRRGSVPPGGRPDRIFALAGFEWG